MTAETKLVVGLGNPGAKYDKTRHNVGFWFIDALTERYAVTLRPQKKLSAALGQADLGSGPVWVMKPTTYVNVSGRAVRAVADYYGLAPAQILVAYDDLELKPGRARIKIGGGHGGHNGMRDIMRHLSGDQCARLRLGIGRPAEKSKVAGWVLSRPPRNDQNAIDQVLNEALDCVPDLAAGNWDRVLEQFA